MKPNFSFGQFIVKKMRPLESCDAIPMMGVVMYSEKNEAEYGVFSIEPYVNGDWEAPIEYKVRLVPVGSSALKFMDHKMYTSDLWGTPDEMIFDDLNLAEMFIRDFLKD